MFLFSFKLATGAVYGIVAEDEVRALEYAELARLTVVRVVGKTKIEPGVMWNMTNCGPAKVALTAPANQKR
ncbi:MAG: hypothetical protein RDU25_02945 [Patescibacteria group bacterium]|nr:hypothetical protein [Patescibacteria group bacterium]